MPPAKKTPAKQAAKPSAAKPPPAKPPRREEAHNQTLDQPPHQHRERGEQLIELREGTTVEVHDESAT